MNYFTFVNAQKKENGALLSSLDRILNRIYFGNINDMVMYRHQTLSYLISDKRDLTVVSGFIKTSVKLNNTTRFIVQNEYLYQISKMTMYFNTPSIGIRKYF